MEVGVGSGGMVVDEGGVFGCVMGVLRGGSSSSGASSCEGKGGDGQEGRGGGEGVEREKQKEGIAMPFCGVWRFDEMGRAVEHWENAADPAALGRWLRGE